MNRIFGNQRPNSITRLINNKYIYCYDIKSEPDVEDENGNIIKQYSWIQLELFGLPNYKDCVKAVIRHFYTQEEEFDLINSYNKSIINSEPDEDYKNYLNLLSEIKENVHNDFQ